MWMRREKNCFLFMVAFCGAMAAAPVRRCVDAQSEPGVLKSLWEKFEDVES